MFTIIQTPISYNVVDGLTYKTVKRFSTLRMAISWLCDSCFVSWFDTKNIYKTEFCL